MTKEEKLKELKTYKEFLNYLKKSQIVKEKERTRAKVRKLVLKKDY